MLRIWWTILDDKKYKARRELNLQDGTTYTQALSYLTALLPLIDASTYGQIVEAGVVDDQNISGLGLKTVPSIASDNEEWGTFLFISSADTDVDVSITAFNESKMLANGRIDDTDPDVAAFVTAIRDGIGGIKPVSTRGYLFETYLHGEEYFAPRKPKKKRRWL